MIYNLDYYIGMLLNYSPTAEIICGIRWNILRKCFPFAKIVLDYGCGCGFFKLYAPSGYIVDTFDVGLLAENIRYPQTGIRHERYDVVCLFDVLEHIDWSQKTKEGDDLIGILKRTDCVLLTIPIKPDNISFDEWKHYKPNEHLAYFTVDSLKEFFGKLNFKCCYQGDDEQVLRQDIKTFAFERM